MAATDRLPAQPQRDELQKLGKFFHHFPAPCPPLKKALPRDEESPMKVFLFFAIAFASTSAKAQVLPEGWKIIHNIDGIELLEHASNKGIKGSWERRKTRKKIDWSRIDGEKFFKKIEKQKKKLLSIVGISNWKAEHYEWKPYNHLYRLRIDGSYTNSTGESITFTEIHFYSPTQTVQILHTRPSAAKNALFRERQIIDYMMQQAQIR